MLDLVGTNETLTLVAPPVARGGVIAQVGEGDGSLSFGFGQTDHEVTLTTSVWGSLEDLKGVLAYAKRGELCWAMEEFPLEHANRALERLRRGSIRQFCVREPRYAITDDESAGEEPMKAKTHESLVSDQFGSQAAAYLKSVVHARGADLDQIEKLVHGQSGARVLDLGCGGGHVSYRVAPHVAEVVAYDLSRQMLAAVRRAATDRGLANLRTRTGRAEALPFADKSFDFVLSRFSAHHWLDMPAGLREARRVMKRHGRALFADSISPGKPLLDSFVQTIELLRDPSHVRNYSRMEWEQALAAAGFRLAAVTERRLPLEFSSWIERMRPPQTHVAAIRSLQKLVASEIAEHFKIQADGSFALNTIVIEASVA